ncbi:hypothetical protein H6G00_26320 [Leptolyngbya sp. FACHB-541]|uniref:hypothetical protein n=1 Tax=Leptolyngbya sp. FACHB-541 TaxID=2692810 RepID=UPI0016861AE3|nr:hypothetical protein [Leptolyngbya sp. FACHB-541]MBD2000084.1 hypothetical protein [Leptolyngbya sp. FACHB-541]
MTSNLITHTAAPILLQQTPVPVSTPQLQPLPLRYPNREPIRHLLIGSPPLVQNTIHQLHNLHYAEAGLWSPEIPPAESELRLTLNPGEVLRILLRYVAIADTH